MRTHIAIDGDLDPLALLNSAVHAHPQPGGAAPRPEAAEYLRDGDGGRAPGGPGTGPQAGRPYGHGHHSGGHHRLPQPRDHLGTALQLQGEMNISLSVSVSLSTHDDGSAIALSGFSIPWIYLHARWQVSVADSISLVVSLVIRIMSAERQQSIPFVC